MVVSMPGDARALYFVKPGIVEVRREKPDLGAGRVLVRSRLMGISHGTELLAFRGELPPGLPADASLECLQASTGYPLKYGYINVGVTDRGARVFCFYPHQDLFGAAPADLVALPDGVSDEDAVFLANLETALGIVHDAAPRFGEQVLVLGLGVVGLLTCELLVRAGVGAVIAVEPRELRRQAGARLGCHAFSPQEPGLRERMAELTGGRGPDLAVNCSGAESALQLAIDTLAAEGTMVEASWYGSRRVSLELGSAFHRRRLRLVSSQVSHLAPHLAPRWDKRRRLDLALDLLPRLGPSRYITHRFPLERAQEAFQLIDSGPEQFLQVVLTP